MRAGEKGPCTARPEAGGARRPPRSLPASATPAVALRPRHPSNPAVFSAARRDFPTAPRTSAHATAPPSTSRASRSSPRSPDCRFPPMIIPRPVSGRVMRGPMRHRRTSADVPLRQPWRRRRTESPPLAGCAGRRPAAHARSRRTARTLRVPRNVRPGHPIPRQGSNGSAPGALSPSSRAYRSSPDHTRRRRSRKRTAPSRPGRLRPPGHRPLGERGSLFLAQTAIIREGSPATSALRRRGENGAGGPSLYFRPRPASIGRRRGEW